MEVSVKSVENNPNIGKQSVTNRGKTDSNEFYNAGFQATFFYLLSDFSEILTQRLPKMLIKSVKSMNKIGRKK